MRERPRELSVLARSLRFFAVATLICFYFYDEPAKQSIDRHLGWPSLAFVILLAGGFGLMGRSARRAGQGEEEAVGDRGES